MENKNKQDDMTAKEKPILFSTPMVQAILRGEKRQTRRVVKSSANKIRWTPIGYCDEHGNPIKQKYEVGDILWVRETWKPGAWLDDGRVAVDYKASPELTKTPWIENFPGFERYFEKWTDELLAKGLKSDSDGYFHWDYGESPLNWRPSIFMPKAAARIFLEVANVRVERLHDITEEDAIAEGVEYKLFEENDDRFRGYRLYGLKGNQFDESPVVSFRSLWESINGKESWNNNPFVFVYEFKKNINNV